MLEKPTWRSRASRSLIEKALDYAVHSDFLSDTSRELPRGNLARMLDRDSRFYAFIARSILIGVSWIMPSNKRNSKIR